MLTKIHHVGLVVRELEAAYGFWRDALGLQVHKEATVKDQGVRAALLPCGETEIELLEPIDPDGGVAKFLAKRGEGLHHLCFESDDVRTELATAKANGLPMLDEAPRAGLAGMIGFLHPKASCGVLVEFAQPPAGSHGPSSVNIAFDHLAIVVDDVADAAQRFSRQFGMHVEQGPDGTPDRPVRLSMSRSALHLYPVATAPARLAGARGLAGIGLRVTALERVVTRLHAARVDTHPIQDAAGHGAGCHAGANGVPLSLWDRAS
jgi:methylmalonyl-CoA/ethylmalonyl-CoA epimerase